ncbi:bifunctional lysylphosphatidylglycerol flippase/synthetase MprF [Arthrobacter caoxuetaonis]|uniref:bifunctional lysylphosphatidylglycerol flippase/synthetase MprF n=1 Tax=Arthrobacter caoxuetaonis TaxID=2886935 RepID=UPI001D13D72A|nr:DUF2156 domain-containing protein [Arthrobacter caoxuetaonis]MCC3281715.1 DUF2156 domain-containing protein [Arthrobacter caoxuetaonis]
MQHGSARRTAGRYLRWPADGLRGALAKSPVTLVFLTLFWFLGILTSSILRGPENPLLGWVSVSVHTLPGHWPALVLSALWANGLAGYIGGTVLALVVGLPAERLLGSLRFLAAAVGTQVTGALAGIGFAAALRGAFENWGRELSTDTFLGPVAVFCGVAAAASAGVGTLWRRRVRLLLFTLLVVLALYSGALRDVVALAAALAGGLWGPYLFGRRPHLPRSLVSSRREARVLVALAVVATAVGPVIAALNVRAVGPLAVLAYLFTNAETLDPVALTTICADPGMQAECRTAKLEQSAGLAGFFLAVLPQVLLVVFAAGLRRGRRSAWIGALVLQGLMTLTAAVHTGFFLAGHTGGVYGVDGRVQPLALVLPMLLPLLIFVLLAATGRRLFAVSAPPGTYRQLFLVCVTAGALLAALWVAGGLVLRTGFTPQASLPTLLADLPLRFLPVFEIISAPPQLLPESVPAIILYEGVGVAFWALTCVLLLRSFLEPAYSRFAADEERARGLLASSGGSTMAWMTLWSGNSYWFSPTGRSYVAYRLNSGVALTVGDPVGPAEELNRSVEGFAAYCTDAGVTACFYSVNEATRDAAAGLGHTDLQVAEETLLPLGSLEFRGRRFQDVRTAFNRARKAGIRAEWSTYRTAPLSVLDQINAISEEWVADKKMPEMGFTLGGIEELDDDGVRLLLAVDQDRTVHGVTSWLPIYRDGQIIGWTLDFMRRRAQGFPAAMDFLIASAALSLQDEGCRLLSLSGAPLARNEASSPAASGAGTAAGTGANTAARRTAATPPALEWLMDRLGATLEPVYGFRSLLAYKAKFQPQYVPLYMTYLDSASLPAIANALARAYLPHVSMGQTLTIARRIIGPQR